MIISDAPNCGVTYDHHYDNYNSLIIQATVVEYSVKIKIYLYSMTWRHDAQNNVTQSNGIHHNNKDWRTQHTYAEQTDIYKSVMLS
jgi:hypothetical protein